MRYWPDIPGGLVIFLTMPHVESLKENLSQILVSHTWGGQSSFDHAHVESFKKKSRWEPGLSYWGVLSSFGHGHVESLKINSS